VNIGSTTQSGTAKYYYFTLSAMTATSVSTSTRVGGTTGAGLAIDTLTIDESTGDLLFFEGSTNGATPFPTGPASNVPTGIIYRLTPGGSLTSAALVPTARINSWFSTTYYKTIGQCTWSDGELYIGLGRIDPAGTFSSWLIKTDTVGSWTDVIVGNDSNAVTKYFFGKPIISTDGSEVYVQRGTNLTSSSISVYSNVFHGTTTG
jgi:hypothetical protein